jgi:O-antigen/teichoic acid export membrane protein
MSEVPQGDATARSGSAEPDEGSSDQNHLGGVARGGALNLVGALVYGASNFALLWVLNRELGITAAGVALVAIAAFNILARVAELGAATGLIRWVSRLRAERTPDLIAPTMWVGLVPVTVISVCFAWVLGTHSDSIAQLFADGETVGQLSKVLAALAPFLPFAVFETVLVSATRGYDVMWPQAAIEKIGRAALLPIVVLVTTRLGGDVVAVARAWAATNLVALVPAVIVTRRLMQRACQTPIVPEEHGAASATPGTSAHLGAQRLDRAAWLATTRSFWAFSAPRAAGQTFEVSIAWIDTLLVSALISTSAAGIYASGTRYVLIGAFVGEALMQVVGPRVSGLMTRHRYRATSHLVRTAAGWQTAITWPMYLLVIAFAPVLLGVFGEQVLAAEGALLALSLGLMVFSLFGPAASVILMGGRSSQAMGNAAAAVTFNVVGNLLLIPWLGITGAGVVWALTLVLSAALPASQAHRQMQVDMVSRTALWTAGIATVTVGVPAAFFRVVAGATPTGLFLATLVGLGAFGAGMWRFRSETGLDDLMADPAQLSPVGPAANIAGRAEHPAGSAGSAPLLDLSDDSRRQFPTMPGGTDGR